jgi:MraZ protein
VTNMTGRLRGHADARIDEKGRLKMPSVFRKTLASSYGPNLFITALTDDHLAIYPIAVWEDIESRVNGLGMMHPLKQKFLTRANRYGIEVEMDEQGRVPLKPNQRQLIGIEDDVSLIGCMDHLELRPAAAVESLQGQDALTQADLEAMRI